MNSHLPAAVDVRNAEKSYGKTCDATLAFTNLNLNVPRGNIYGLLGPSGCGKTTLLRCILGRLKLDKGSVKVFGHYPGSPESGIPGPTVGYMAQESTVYLTMTIAEYLRYFGTILGLSKKEIQTKTEYFIDILRLPSKDTLTTKLSGGQTRCVQFAAACIHDPRLIILDEPTVGIDVITKERMWNHIVKMTKHSEASIILTTHYIEEARMADRVGMIHGRTMAVEDSTDNLMARYNETTLEAVFLKVCYQECDEVVVSNDKPSQNGTLQTVASEECQSGKTTQNHSGVLTLGSGCTETLIKKSQTSPTFTKGCGLNISWQRLYPIMMRTFISLYRFPGVLLLLVLLPSSQVLTYTQIMANDIGGIKMVIINDDAGELGAQYLSYLDPYTIIQKPYDDYQVGFEALWRGENHGILHIKSNFSAVVHKRYTDAALSNDEFVKAGTIDIQMDNTNFNIAKFAEFHVLKMFQHFLYDTLDLAGYNPAVSRLPINISDETEDLLIQPPSLYVLSGEIILCSFFSALPVAVFNIFMERHKGYMEPNLIAGVTALEIIFGVILGQLFILIFQVAGIIMAAPPLFGSTNKGSFFMIFCLLYVQGLCGTTLGIFLSLLCDQVIILFQVASGLICFGAALTGVFWPIESMPVFFRYFCECLPMALPARAMALVIHRGWNLYYISILSAFGISFVWIIIFLVLSLVLIYIKE